MTGFSRIYGLFHFDLQSSTLPLEAVFHNHELGPQDSSSQVGLSATSQNDGNCHSDSDGFCREPGKMVDVRSLIPGLQKNFSGTIEASDPFQKSTPVNPEIRSVLINCGLCTMRSPFRRRRASPPLDH